MDSIKVREYLKSLTNSNCERPLATISPIQEASTQEATSHGIHQFLNKQTVFSTKSPLLTHLSSQQQRLHSTPKPLSCSKVNFHSIDDLAQSSCSTPNSSRTTDSSGYQTALSLKCSHLATSLFDSNKENSPTQVSSSSFQGQFVDLKADTSARRKPRTQITRYHREILDQVYAANKYPDANEVENLCKLLGFEENVIRIWFQNKRARNKTKSTLSLGNRL